MDYDQKDTEILEQELMWFTTVLETRIMHYFKQKEDVPDPLDIPRMQHMCSKRTWQKRPPPCTTF